MYSSAFISPRSQGPYLCRFNRAKQKENSLKEPVFFSSAFGRSIMNYTRRIAGNQRFLETFVLCEGGSLKMGPVVLGDSHIAQSYLSGDGLVHQV